MAKRREGIEAEALNLPRDEGASLAKALLASLEDDREVERAWAEEVARGVVEIGSGKVELIPGEDVYADPDNLPR